MTSTTTENNDTAAPSIDTQECDRCHHTFPSEDMVVVHRTQWDSPATHKLCPACITRATVVCSHCEGRVYIGATAPVYGGGTICQRCRYSPTFQTCCCCNRTDVAENFVRSNGSSYCPDCRDRHANFDFGDFIDDGRTDRIGSERRYGIELETDECDGHYTSLSDHPAWGAKEDCTVDGKEFYSAILSGDAGLDAVDDIAEIADENSWRVSSNCGYHLHLDMTGELRDSLYAIVYAYRATQEVWLSLVSRNRRSGSYCHTCRFSCDDIDRAVGNRNGLGTRFQTWAGHTDRYNWVNAQAYGCHGTIEIRLHDGTCDGEAVTNWIKAHTRFTDWASKLGYEGVKKALSGLTADELFIFIVQEIWNDGDLTIYYGTRARLMSGSYLDKSVGRPARASTVTA